MGMPHKICHLQLNGTLVSCEIWRDISLAERTNNLEPTVQGKQKELGVDLSLEVIFSGVTRQPWNFLVGKLVHTLLKTENQEVAKELHSFA